jgi:hypothetical protein
MKCYTYIISAAMFQIEVLVLGREQFRQCTVYLACGCSAMFCGTNAVGLISQWGSHSVTIGVVRK